MSDSDRVQLAFIEETTFGEAKTGSNLQKLRCTGESLAQTSNTQKSAELRPDRQITNIIRTSKQAGGDIPFELSYGTYDDFLQAALQSGDWSAAVTVTASTIAAVESGNTITDSGNGFGSLVANQWVYIDGFDTAANNGFFKIVTAAAGQITVSGGTLVDESAGESVTITMGGQIVNSTTLKTFNVERQYTDLSEEFSLFIGVAIDTFNLSVPAEGIVTGNFGILGLEEESKSASAGSGYDAVTTTNAIDTSDDAAKLLESNVSCDMIEFSLSVSNQLRRRPQVGPQKTPGSGRINTTGTMKAYYENKTLYDKALNMTASSVALCVQDDAGNGYVIEMPQLKFTDGKRISGSAETDVIADMSWEAYMDPTEGITIRIARFPVA